MSGTLDQHQACTTRGSFARSGVLPTQSMDGSPLNCSLLMSCPQNHIALPWPKTLLVTLRPSMTPSAANSREAGFQKDSMPLVSHVSEHQNRHVTVLSVGSLQDQESPLSVRIPAPLGCWWQVPILTYWRNLRAAQTATSQARLYIFRYHCMHTVSRSWALLYAELKMING